MTESLLTNRLKMVRLAHRSGNDPLFSKNMNECLILASEYARVHLHRAGDQDQDRMVAYADYCSLTKSAF